MTAGASILNYFAILKQNFKLAVCKQLIWATIYLCIIPIFYGITNLDKIHSAECMEKFVSLIGIIFLVPLCKKEQDMYILEVVYSKKFEYIKVILIRIILALVMMLILVTAFAIVLIQLNCNLSLGIYIVGTFISALFLGTIGLFGTVVSHNIVTGYLVSFAYLLFNWIDAISKESRFYLFSLMNSEFEQKEYLLIAASLFLLASVLYINWLSSNFDKRTN